MPQKVCRLCLIKPSVCFSILDSSVTNMLEALTFTKVSPTDEISTIVCLKCLLNLKLAYSIQQTIKRSEQKLIERVKIKQECDEPQHRETYDLVKLSDGKCVICGLSIQDNLMNDHIREHFNSEQKCAICDEKFADIQQYREHLFEHPDKIIHKCTNCKAKFQYKSFYDVHVRTACSTQTQRRIAALGLHSKQAISLLTEKKKRKIPVALHEVDDEPTRKKVFKLGLRSSQAIKVLLGNEDKDDGKICNICYKKFTKKSFQCHTHETKTCTICNREVSKYGYKKHMDDHMLGPQVCHLCGATLQNKSCLTAHIFYSHNDSRYKCEHCGRFFQKKHARDLHVQKEHVGEPTHFCDTCGKGFYTGRFLNKHIKMKHLRLRPHVCEYCKKGFSSRYALKTHKRQHTNETPYRCEVCGDGFRQNVSLRVFGSNSQISGAQTRAHRKSKHDIVEENVCNCKVCGKGFASDSALHSHMRLH